MIEAELPQLPPEAFEPLLEERRWERFTSSLEAGRNAMDGRTLWHVSSTVTGGGVAELLMSALGYLRGAGVNSRWMAIEGTEDFFVVTKRIHHLLHGKEGDGENLGDDDRRCYERVLRRQFGQLASLVEAGDVVVLHDPQVVGLAPRLRDLGVGLIWNCHIGADTANDLSRRAWRFLLPFVTACHTAVFSRKRHVWEGLAGLDVAIVPPCIDAFSAKNHAMDDQQVAAILAATGIVSGDTGRATYLRRDGTEARVSTRSELVEESPLPASAPIVCQVSRWDPLKDHSGLAAAFAEGVPASLDAHLVLAGPAPEAVSDDPEGEATLVELRECWSSLPAGARRRVHIACIPMADVEENAAIVNALQRRSQVVAQKSLAEGFGLTVAEALWKERPIVASGVGGIQDQIVDGESGFLVDDPTDLAAFADAISTLLTDPRTAERLGRNGRTAVLERFLAPNYLESYLSLVAASASGD